METREREGEKREGGRERVWTTTVTKPNGLTSGHMTHMLCTSIYSRCDHEWRAERGRRGTKEEGYQRQRDCAVVEMREKKEGE